MFLYLVSQANSKRARRGDTARELRSQSITGMLERSDLTRTCVFLLSMQALLLQNYAKNVHGRTTFKNCL